MNIRNIISHQTGTGDLNDRIHISSADEPGAGGGHHSYLVTHQGTVLGQIYFHHVQPAGKFTPGLTNEALLAIVRDRLQCFQDGAFACEENAYAMHHIDKALQALTRRTKRRQLDGTEGLLEERSGTGESIGHQSGIDRVDFK